MLEISTAGWTAIGTVTLAIVTIIYVAVTAWLGRSARASAASAETAAAAAERSAAAAREGVAIGERNLLLNVMPLVEGVQHNTTSAGGRLNVQFRLTNRGQHAAFNLHGRVRIATAGGVSNQPFGPLGVILGPSQSHVEGPMTFDIRLDPPGTVTVAVEYQDPLGNRYRTVTTEERKPGRIVATTSVSRHVDGSWQRMVEGPEALSDDEVWT